ncbi:MAG: Panacea domain-containing protein [Parcubacteria group bacterium]|jgi:uncharacterized phage-associated protein
MFDDRKATQLLNYLAQKEGGKINFLKSMKLVYLIDKFHLRKYGKTITGDLYYAMSKGPVASNTKDICKYILRDDMDYGKNDYYDKYIKKGRVKFTLQSIQQPDLEYFSEVEIESIDAVYEQFKGFSGFKLVDITHDTFEWKCKSEFLKKGALREQMRLSDFLIDQRYSERSPLRIFNTTKTDLERVSKTYDLIRNTRLSCEC